MSYVVEVHRASNVNVTPYARTRSLTTTGESVHNHNGNPTAAISHSFTDGSGPSGGTAHGT